MKAFKTNIEKDTLENTNYRKVIFTGEKIQLVLMSLKPGEEIPKETHKDIDQFIRIESGQAKAYIGEENFDLKDDDVIIVPSGKPHRIINTSKSEELKLYSIYANPEHAPKTIHKTKSEADKAHAEEH